MEKVGIDIADYLLEENRLATARRGRNLWRDWHRRLDQRDYYQTEWQITPKKAGQGYAISITYILTGGPVAQSTATVAAVSEDHIPGAWIEDEESEDERGRNRNVCLTPVLQQAKEAHPMP